MTPERTFDFEIALCIAIVWVCAVLWTRWYIRRLLVKEFVKQLKQEAAIRRIFQ